MIWTMAAPALLMTTAFLSRTSWLGVGSTVWWISLVAFHSRNSPPAIRIRSRQLKVVSNDGSPWLFSGPWKPRSNTGAVRPTIQPMVASRPSRMIRARPMPSRRTFCLCSGGSLFDRMEMKTRLSIPSTTSITMRVVSASQAAGSVSRGTMASSMGVLESVAA